jgi:hypothetical protein
LSLRIVALGLFSRRFTCPATRWRWQFYPGSTSLGQSYCNRLLWAARAVFSLADVMHFLTDKFSRLGGWRFAFLFVFPSPFQSLLFWHIPFLSTQATAAANGVKVH